MLEQIKRNIEDLISRYEVLKAENQRLNGLLQLRQEEVDKAREEISALQQTIENLKLKNAFAGGDNEAAKEKIDRLIHQIDKCMAMLR